MLILSYLEGIAKLIKGGLLDLLHVLTEKHEKITLRCLPFLCFFVSVRKISQNPARRIYDKILN